MAYIWKLRHKFRNPIIYVAYALLALFIFTLVKIFIETWLPLAFRYQQIYKTGTKYILLWDSYYLILKFKEPILPNLQCRVNNCIFTKDKDLLDGDYRHFDALIFSEQMLKRYGELPQKRSLSQIYIFTTIESSYHYPACEVNYDNFFNLTFTYRLDSDVLWPFFLVRNVTHHTVAPRKHVKWQKYRTRRIPPSIVEILRNKTKAAAWLVSHCYADSLRDNYLSRLQEHLFHFSLKIDVYGGCNNVKCTNDDCGEMLARDYYFYMAFENSFSEDYVTEKVLHGYQNYVVPIVYGSANYTRFLPPGSYLNARKLHPYNLAYIMHNAIKNPTVYDEFFKWTNYYTVDSVDEVKGTHPLCDLCEALHSNKGRPRTYMKFRKWWNGDNGMKWCLPADYWNETSFIQIDNKHLLDMMYS